MHLSQQCYLLFLTWDLRFVGIITGSVVVETIFGLPGIGKLFVNAAFNRDYSLVMGVTILIGFLFILFNAIVDILLALIDPKIRY